ncbi:hypothetical protein ASPFODRAFT_140070 [Aspergillus luchuensis CBS 106.47]|uniref:Uncharacterized protein n=1 Tax=Aspergillus luchuensis (strain CBS 106.47) TaxID=1137211 RepID=A0A1M3TBF0_ASPLC|nr:hypothetical protein ASPFODRAFT_140070 [Aspergillus luchuensis CBS 106.47]
MAWLTFRMRNAEVQERCCKSAAETLYFHYGVDFPYSPKQVLRTYRIHDLLCSESVCQTANAIEMLLAQSCAWLTWQAVVVSDRTCLLPTGRVRCCAESIWGPVTLSIRWQSPMDYESTQLSANPLHSVDRFGRWIR